MARLSAATISALKLFRGHFLLLGGLFSFHGGLCCQHLGIAGAALLYVLFPPTRAGTQFSRAPKRAPIAPCRARRLGSRVRERARKGLFTGAKTAPHLTLRLSLLVLAKCRASALLWFPPPQQRRVRHVGGQPGEPRTCTDWGCRARSLGSRVRERARQGLFTGAKTASHLTRRLHLVVLAQCRASTLLWFPPRKSAA